MAHKNEDNMDYLDISTVNDKIRIELKSTCDSNHSLKVYIMVEEHNLEDGDFDFPPLPLDEEINDEYNKKREAMKGVDRLVHDSNLSKDYTPPAAFMYLSANQTPYELLCYIINCIEDKCGYKFFADQESQPLIQ